MLECNNPLDKPLVSVIILNYNGAQYLPACLDALYRQTYARDCFEVIVSDNGSRDNSLSLLKEKYPWVKIIENGKNLGFSQGNNIAIRASRGDFVVLLNNDTAPTEDWLDNLVQVALDHPAAGMVTAHLQLFYDEIALTLKAETFTPGNDPRQLGVQVFNVDSGLQGGVVQYLDGFYGWEHHSSLGRFRWMGAQARIGVPVPPGDGAWEVAFSLSAQRELEKPVCVEVRLQEEVLKAWQVSGRDLQVYKIELPASARKYAHSLEQNTGSLVFHSGAGRDRGTYVKDNEMFFEIDQGQYGSIEEVFAGCGASLLLRRSMLDEIGSLDEDFFMYYEDTDLAWRARLYGWKVLYAPQAKVRHIHCGTTKEWSSNFMLLTERNRLAMVFKNGAFYQVARVWAGYFLKVFNLSIKTLIRLLIMRPDWRHLASQVKIHLRVMGAIISWIPRLLGKRRRIMRQRRVSPQQLRAWFVEEA